MKEAYERFEYLREIISDSKILDSIAQILSTDRLNELCDDLCHEYDINEDEI